MRKIFAFTSKVFFIFVFCFFSLSISYTQPASSQGNVTCTNQSGDPYRCDTNINCEVGYTWPYGNNYCAQYYTDNGSCEGISFSCEALPAPPSSCKTESQRCDQSVPGDCCSGYSCAEDTIGQWGPAGEYVCQRDTRPLDACTITSASWRTNNGNLIVNSGESVFLLVNTSGDCSGKSVFFTIKEKDPFFNDTISFSPNTATINGDIAETSWQAVWEADGVDFNLQHPFDPEYIFSVNLSETSREVESNNELLVLQNAPPPSSGQLWCGQQVGSNGETTCVSGGSCSPGYQAPPGWTCDPANCSPTPTTANCVPVPTQPPGVLQCSQQVGPNGEITCVSSGSCGAGSVPPPGWTCDPTNCPPTPAIANCIPVSGTLQCSQQVGPNGEITCVSSGSCSPGYQPPPGWTCDPANCPPTPAIANCVLIGGGTPSPTLPGPTQIPTLTPVPVLTSVPAPVFRLECPPDVPCNTTLSSVSNFVLGLLVAVGVIAALVFLIYGGIKYITSGGNKQAVEIARSHITLAVIGLLIIVLAWAITRMVLDLLGVSFSNIFSIPNFTGT